MTYLSQVTASLKWLAVAGLLIAPLGALAQDSLLAGGWQLDPDASSIKFQSVKNGSKVETSRFANFNGVLDENGLATVLVELNSVDTEVDLRNVRMRFLFFETYRFPIATVSARVEESTLQTLQAKRRMKLPVEFELELHGVKQTLSVDTTLTQFADDQISITSSSPVTIAADQFDLMEGILKLQDAANVEILPSGSVSFDLTFTRNGVNAAASTVPQAVPTAVAASTQSVALETSGNFSVEECTGRFDILSQTRAINFRFGSSELDDDSYLMLGTLLDIIKRCPDMNIVVGGHTDSSGSDATNMQLSSARAESVTNYLLENDVEADRVRSVGFGESSPLVPNDTQRNRARNRRIEFTIDNR